ncbi:MAG: NADH-quinone oxidoreductase subunit A [Candidatus Heimdallarchaeum aukensis]|uniref:NADH-quinone oxidoreductase subunit A n=1 Tax=Candidatus Heimdallarchaeum aukensis TaxID=2876573 RepID=A0A9Y1BKT3_9ARCH|nr:MAG: NADH-quinone oxidoreductase subunit A [Candidatus Heimdallarchaeum aukensis]
MMLFDAIIPVLALGLAGMIFVGIMMTLSVLTKPKGEKTKLKLQTYESGEVPVTDRLGFQFNYQYFVYAIVFTALDVMSIFLYAWAVDSARLETNTLLTILGFITILFLGFVYVSVATREWKKNIM